MLESIIIQIAVASVVLNMILAAALSIIRRERKERSTEADEQRANSAGRLRLSKTLAWAHAKIRIAAKDLIAAKSNMSAVEWAEASECFIRKVAGENE